MTSCMATPGTTLSKGGRSRFAGWLRRNDLWKGGFDNDTLKGGSDNDSLYGEDGDDMWTELGKDTMDGGAGDYDKLFASAWQRESVERRVRRRSRSRPARRKPTIGVVGQTPVHGCCALYRYDVSYSELRARHAGLEHCLQLRARHPAPESGRTIMKNYKSNTQLKSEADFEDVLDRLAEGRPSSH